MVKLGSVAGGDDWGLCLCCRFWALGFQLWIVDGIVGLRRPRDLTVSWVGLMAASGVAGLGRLETVTMGIGLT